MSNSGLKTTGWLDEDDIDDELFLKNSRKPLESNATSTANQITQLTSRREAIESRTLESSERSLALLRESEQVGVETAKELASQREQLERTSRNLDEINSTLRSTQRNIDGIKSVFTSLRNYLTGPKDPPSSSSIEKPPVAIAGSSQPASNIPQYPIAARQVTSDGPIRKPATAQEAVERNLGYMSENITNLRGLALNLGDEILEQNELLDNMQYKADKAGDTISKQNSQINRLLGKK